MSVVFASSQGLHLWPKAYNEEHASSVDIDKKGTTLVKISFNLLDHLLKTLSVPKTANH